MVIELYLLYPLVHLKNFKPRTCSSAFIIKKRGRSSSFRKSLGSFRGHSTSGQALSSKDLN